jgi:ATP-dependent Clp protease ATP-binding subunit ClpA
MVYEEIRSKIMEMLRQHLPPEFYNRVDDMIVFHSLSREHIRKIVKLQFARLTGSIRKQGISLILEDDALDYLTRHGYQPEFGARPIRRLIQREVINELARSIIEGKLTAKDQISVGFREGKLDFKKK